MGRDPKELKRGTSQVGAELTSPWTLWDGKMHPVAYADFQANESIGGSPAPSWRDFNSRTRE